MTEYDRDPVIALTLGYQNDYAIWAAEQDAAAHEQCSIICRQWLEKLWHEIAPDLRPVARGWLRSGIALDSESLAMNMFTYIVEKLSTLNIDPQRNVRGLLVTVARRGIIDDYQHSYAVSPKRHPSRIAVSFDTIPDLIDHQNSDVEVQVMYRIDHTVVLETVWGYWKSSLVQDDMKIMHLRWQIDPPCSFRDIAQQMGAGWIEDTVRQRHHRIMNATRKHLRDRGLLDDSS